MRIAQVAPLYESVPPKLYGGTERVVAYLTDALVQQGHDVTLFASGDSTASGRLRPTCKRALRLEGKRIVDPIVHQMRMIELVAREYTDFDIVHFHIDYLHFPLARRQRVATVTTQHGRLDIPELHSMYLEYDEMHLVSVSDDQRKSMPWARWAATAYHGLPKDLYHLQERPGQYLAFLGRICPEKRVDRAIEIARRVGMPIKIAAKIDAADMQYFNSCIRRLFDDPLVEYLGEIGEPEKAKFLGDAYALLFPVDWPEPFGLVMIEAMACGTPVIAYNMGSVAEIIDDGVTGFIVSNLNEAVDAVGRVGSLDRRVCRSVFEQRFTAGRMCSAYLAIYERVVSCEGHRQPNLAFLSPVQQ